MCEPIPGPWTHGFAAANGVRLHYVEAAPAGPARGLALLLHGWPEFWYSWRHQLPALAAAGWRAVAPDLRGYNLSDRPRGGYDLATLSQDVVALVGALGAERAALVGHDWGGTIAWDVAMQRPDLVDRLAVLNAPHPALLLRAGLRPTQVVRSWYALFFQLPALPEWLLARQHYRALLRALLRTATRPGVFTPEDLERYRAAWSQPGALAASLAYYRALRRFGPERLRARLRRIDRPTLVLWGERDPALGTGFLRGLERWVTDLTVRRFPDTGHWLHQEVVAEVNAALAAFLAEPRGERPDAAPAS